jgi:hypothetical protein
MPEQVARCFWCYQENDSHSWACTKCYPLKEAAYRKAQERGITNYGEIISMVYDELEAAGRMPTVELIEQASREWGLPDDVA